MVVSAVVYIVWCGSCCNGCTPLVFIPSCLLDSYRMVNGKKVTVTEKTVSPPDSALLYNLSIYNSRSFRFEKTRMTGKLKWIRDKRISCRSGSPMAPWRQHVQSLTVATNLQAPLNH